MLRQKAYSAINLAGLSIGMAATLIIVIYVIDELSYDKFHKDAEKIFRVTVSGTLQGTEFKSATSAAPVAETLLREVPQVDEVVRFGVWSNEPVSYNDKAFTEPRMLVADSNFFKFFSFYLLKGDAENILTGPNQIVLTLSSAKRYFGDEDPIGKILLRGSQKTATVVIGIAQDPPHNSHIDFDLILSGSSWDYMQSPYWTTSNLYTYVKARSSTDGAAISAHLNTLVEKYVGADVERFLGMSFAQFLTQGNRMGLFLQPLEDIHLRSDLSGEITPNGNIQYLNIFSVVAFFIILIACINFMNLSTARSGNRAKEVGVRKTLGAVKQRLIFQFLSESMLYSICSTVLAIAFIGAALPVFNKLSGKQLDYLSFGEPLFMTIIIAFTIMTGIIAGSYPAFYLTAFKPVDVLKGRMRAGFGNLALRNVLVVFQFIISICLIFGSLVVYKQLAYLQEKNLGFDRENIVNLLHTNSLGTNAIPFKNEIAARPEFQGASYVNKLPPRNNWNIALRKRGTEQDFNLNAYHVDADHLKVMGFTMAQGRFFSKNVPSDVSAVILNETAFRQMGYDTFEVGETVLAYNTDPPSTLTIIGVVKDFNFESLRSNVKPMAILRGREPNYEMAIRLSAGNTQEAIAVLETIWKKYSNGTPFEYSFVDDNFDALFRSEQQMSSIILIFTLLAVCIASLGLFGLTAYTAEQRAKEISIRKVLGASVSQIMLLLSRNFTLLIVIAFIIAAPFSWYLANWWLSRFAFHTNVDAWLVIIAGVASLVIAMITICYQSARAANENPVNAMRSE